MDTYIKSLCDRIEFLEFRQSILFLKQPHHKASVFYEITIEDFIKIRDFVRDIETLIGRDVRYTFDDFEKELFDLWPSIKIYPNSSKLVAKVLMSSSNYDSLFKYYN